MKIHKFHDRYVAVHSSNASSTAYMENDPVVQAWTPNYRWSVQGGHPYSSTSTLLLIVGRGLRLRNSRALTDFSPSRRVSSGNR